MKKISYPLTKPEWIQGGLIALLLGAALFTLVKIWSQSNKGHPPVSAVVLPERINLQAWQLISSQPLPFPTHEGVKRLTNHLDAGRLYQYQRQKMPLSLELWAIENTNGDVSAYIDAYAQQVIAPDRQQAEIRYRPGVGFYGLLHRTDRTYLSSCINATGETTFTMSQFSEARFQRDLNFMQVAQWIAGQKPLFKKRCLWSHFSIPTTIQNPKIDSILEEAWLHFFQQSLPNHAIFK